MSQMLKCPNPSCPYIFDPSQVPVGVVLSCPRCGMQFTLGQPPAAPPQPGAIPPALAPTAPPATARPPAAPSQETEFETMGRTVAEERSPDDYLPTRGTSRAQAYILAGIAVVLMAGTIASGIFLITSRNRNADAESGDGSVQMPDLNLLVESSPAGWVRDDNIRSVVGPPYIIGYRHEKPEAYITIGATEPEKGRMPRPSEMRRDLMNPFPKLYDVSTLRPQPPATTEWLGEAISSKEPLPNGFTFLAQSPDGLTWFGETYTVANKGVAYYWMAWCGEKDYETLKGEFATFRSKCKLTKLRDDWKETRSTINDYKGDTVAYTISDAEGLWREVPQADLTELKMAEPNLDKRLRIRITPRRDRKARPEEAELSVFLLPGDADPQQTVRKFVEEREVARIKQANSDFKPPTFTELTDTPMGDPVPEGVPAPAPTVRLMSNVAESKSANRLLVASGIKSGSKTVVVVCWCEASRRDLFETKFVQIASSLRE